MRVLSSLRQSARSRRGSRCRPRAGSRLILAGRYGTLPSLLRSTRCTAPCRHDSRCRRGGGPGATREPCRRCRQCPRRSTRRRVRYGSGSPCRREAGPRGTLALLSGTRTSAPYSGRLFTPIRGSIPQNAPRGRTSGQPWRPGREHPVRHPEVQDRRAPTSSGTPAAPDSSGQPGEPGFQWATGDSEAG